MTLMNIHQAGPTDSDAFLRWNLGREGKRELVKGKIIEMMTGATRAHILLVRRLARFLEDHLDGSRYDVLPTDLGVKTPQGVRYPDIVVDPTGGGSGDLAATNPILIAEVLSRYSRRIDLIDKAAEYAGLASLKAYIVISQHEPRIWLWTRQGDTWAGPSIVEGVKAVISIPSLALAIPLRELYPDAAPK